MAQWSPMIITICLYILFITMVLSISFPLKSHSKVKFDRIESERKNSIGFMSSDNDDDGKDNGVDGDGGGDGGEEDNNNVIIDDANRLGENEQRYIQRAQNLPSYGNRSDILRDAFQR